MNAPRTPLSRRQILASTVGLAAGLHTSAWATSGITIAVPQAPWYPSFERLTTLFERSNATKVQFDVSPFTGLLDKTRNALRSGESPFDIVCINSQFIPEFYTSGLLMPLNRIDASFKLQSEIINFDNTIRWDAQTKTFDPKGEVMAIPVNGNIQLLYYRADLYAAKKLQVPKTWEELAANAKALTGSGEAGFGFRGNRGFFEASYDFYPVLASFGGDIFRDARHNDYTVTLNSPQALRALQFLQKVAAESGPQGIGSVTQARLIQLMTSGKLAQAMLIAAAWPQMDDPQRSSVVGKVNVAPLPAGPSGKAVTTLGHWIAAVPKNLPLARQKAALAFLDWFQQKTPQMQYRDVGAVPIRQDVLSMNVGNDPKYRLLPAVAASSANTRLMLPVPQAAEIADVMELHLNKAYVGDTTPADALNQMAHAVENIMSKAGVKTGHLPDLK